MIYIIIAFILNFSMCLYSAISKQSDLTLFFAASFISLLILNLTITLSNKKIGVKIVNFIKEYDDDRKCTMMYCEDHDYKYCPECGDLVKNHMVIVSQ